MAKTPKDEQDFFGHWLSDNGWMFDIETEDIWLNVEKGTFAHTIQLYAAYQEERLSMAKAGKLFDWQDATGEPEADYTITSTFID